MYLDRANPSADRITQSNKSTQIYLDRADTKVKSGDIKGTIYCP
jgi:hypothetical protein